MKSGQSACMFRISHGFQCRQDRRYIAVTCTLPLKSENDDITTFLRPLKVHRCWRYMYFYTVYRSADIIKYLQSLRYILLDFLSRNNAASVWQDGTPKAPKTCFFQPFLMFLFSIRLTFVVYIDENYVKTH